MSIADRVEAAAVKRGTLSNLPGQFKPLPEERQTQVHISTVPKNMEARAEAEMKRADRAGMLKGLGGGALAERHAVGSGSHTQQAIQQYVQKETMKK